MRVHLVRIRRFVRTGSLLCVLLLCSHCSSLRARGPGARSRPPGKRSASRRSSRTERVNSCVAAARRATTKIKAIGIFECISSSKRGNGVRARERYLNVARRIPHVWLRKGRHRATTTSTQKVFCKRRVKKHLQQSARTEKVANSNHTSSPRPDDRFIRPGTSAHPHIP